MASRSAKKGKPGFGAKPDKANAFGGGDSYVAKDAGLKRGGRAHENHGKAMEMKGQAAHKRLDRPGRKRGGGVGADSSPLTSAANLSAPSKSSEDD